NRPCVVAGSAVETVGTHVQATVAPQAELRVIGQRVGRYVARVHAQRVEPPAAANWITSLGNGNAFIERSDRIETGVQREREVGENPAIVERIVQHDGIA